MSNTRRYRTYLGENRLHHYSLMHHIEKQLSLEQHSYLVASHGICKKLTALRK